MNTLNLNFNKLVKLQIILSKVDNREGGNYPDEGKENFIK